MHSKIRLNAPAGNLPSLIAAVDAGADSVYIGFRSPTNLRNLPGLNFSPEEAAKAVQYAHAHGAEVHVAVNTHPTDEELEDCRRAVDLAADIGADALIAADWGVLEYARTRWPDLNVHLSCLAGAADPAAVRFYQKEFDVTCVVLPRVLSLEQIVTLRKETDVLLEVIGFGVLCGLYEGRCCLSSFITGTGANSVGACAPAEFVEFEETREGRTILRLNGLVVNSFDLTERRTYPTPCKGKYYNETLGLELRAFQDSCCLNALPLLGELAAAGVNWVKIEGRQRSLAYVRRTTGIWRKAIDTLGRRDVRQPTTCTDVETDPFMEGQASTLGALRGG